MVFVVLVNGRRRGGGTPRGLPHEHDVPHTHVVSDRGESQVAVNLSPAMTTTRHARSARHYGCLNRQTRREGELGKRGQRARVMGVRLCRWHSAHACV